VACLKAMGKEPCEKDKLAKVAIRGAKVTEQDLRRVDEIISDGEDLQGIEVRILYTSPGVTAEIVEGNTYKCTM